SNRTRRTHPRAHRRATEPPPRPQSIRRSMNKKGRAPRGPCRGEPPPAPPPLRGGFCGVRITPRTPRPLTLLPNYNPARRAHFLIAQRSHSIHRPTFLTPHHERGETPVLARFLTL